MTIYSDMTSYKYLADVLDPNVLNVGWIGADATYAKGPVSDLVIDRLKEFTKFSIATTRGGHMCDLCDPNKVVFVHIDSQKYLLGTAELRVFSEQGAVFTCPDMLLHYVQQHKYCPPREFLEALMECPLPSSPRYKTEISRLGLGSEPKETLSA